GIVGKLRCLQYLSAATSLRHPPGWLLRPPARVVRPVRPRVVNTQSPTVTTAFTCTSQARDMRLLILAIGGGLGLWLIGYVLGIVLFAFVPVGLIGWIIMPIGVLITIWILLKVSNEPPRFYVLLSIA